MSGPFYDIATVIDGRRCTGAWSLRMGGQLHVVVWGAGALSPT